VVERRYDVAIAGAGPAGASLAIRLAREGFSVALLDAQRFPRFKPCGEFMSPEVLPILDELGIRGRLAQLGAREVRGMLLHAHGLRVQGRFVDIGAAHAPFDYGWAVRREVFDAELVRAAQRAGVELLEGHRVTGVLRDSDGGVRGVACTHGVRERREVLARFTVGADGTRSRIATELGVRRETPWLRKIALVTRYRGVPWGDRAEVHLLEHGFFAVAPVDGGDVSLNLVLNADEFERLGMPRDEALEHWLERTPLLGERIRAGSRIDPVRGTGAMAMRTTRQVFDGAALVGDASGYVDPITGERIFFAMKGAQMLAPALAAALHDGRCDAQALRGYVAGRRREIVPRAAFSLLLQRGLRHPTLVRTAFGFLAQRPRLVDTLVSLTGDYVPLRELARPSVWWRALGTREDAA
jgi:flavin-dependent dehydrogenase